MSDILCIALNPTVDVSCEAEQVRHTFKVRTHNQRHDPGGGGINVARVVAELGGSAEVIYLSGGATGALLDDCMEKTGLPRHNIVTEAPTRVSYMVREMLTELEYRFVPEGLEINPASVEKVVERVAAFEGDYVVASGSLPQGLPDDTYAKIAESMRDAGTRFVLDTSGAALQSALDAGGLFLIKPSIGELQKLVGRRLDEDDAQNAAMNIVRGGGARYVAVSMGAEGAFLASETGVLRLHARRVNVQSAVGAGDSFVGAMVHSLAAGRDVEAAFRLGMAAGAAAVMTPGTQLCRRKDVEALFDGR
ncbi:1-phosphofructokinase family hexose kinase [Hoeflea prorocentri]|uniref:Phosphofructokinase n=1 Tax=Hoeflea prorocentri TaxID=1922333 RepID=A0A9X3ZGD1_9HYPH|nr:hexose kinase [Hoeflea prorocentri]MCY6379666.1 hexose kinase [Hoeflea prorocentri]MDA5397466.1 hexose kinase [Hoeflea prorocentri]